MHFGTIVTHRATERSNRAEIRNPILALPAIARLRELDPEVRVALQELLLDLQQDARARAETSWRRSQHIGQPAASMQATSLAPSGRASAAGAESERKLSKAP